MERVTFPSEAVAAELAARFVPVKIDSARAGDLSRRMNLRWLPGLVVASHDERPANAQIGFLEPADLLTELDFGRAIVAMGRKSYDEAHAAFRAVTEREGAERAPDAWYWWGISAYRQSKDFADCQRLWAEVARRWPGTQWARRVEYALPRPGESG